MALFDLSAMTINEEEANQLSQAIFERTITGGDLSEFHDIVTGVSHKQQIPFIGNMELVGKTQTGCTREESTETIPLTEKFWDPALIGDRLKHCSTDVNNLFKLFQRASKINPDFYDRIGSEEFGVIIAAVESAMKKMNNRLVWFGDTAADNVTDGGVITDGTDVAFFSSIDGLWKQIFAEITTSDTNYVEIAENALVSKAAQDALGATTAYDTFKAMYNKMDARFFEAMEDGASPEFLVTRGMAQNWEDKLEEVSMAFSLTEVKDGTDRLRYRGIPIKIKNDWDSNIRSYQDNGTTWNLPHRALLTVKENIPVGTVSESDLTAIESWFEKKDKANYIDFDLKLDAKFLLDYMAVVAY